MTADVKPLAVFAGGKFDRDYASCRDRFLSLAEQSGGELNTYINPLLGPNGERLTTDTVLVGDTSASNLVVVISGTHGLELFAGSAVQVQLLTQLSHLKLRDTAILIVHAINPWGAAYYRRQNEYNVDINRNFLSAESVRIENWAYEKLHPMIHDKEFFIDGKRNALITKKIDTYIASYGSGAYQTALFQGQSMHPDGVGFCGDQQCWSSNTIIEICASHNSKRKHVAIVDLHTGLGPFGHGSLFFPNSSAHQNFSIAQAWFGQNIVAIMGDDSMPYQPQGDMLSGICTAFTHCTDVVGIALEFGTYDVEQLMNLQIEDTWLNSFGSNEEQLGQQIKEKLVEFFCPDSKEWNHQIISKSEEVFIQLIDKISS